MNKLYALYYVPDEDSWARFICASNSIDKLTAITPNRSWYVGTKDVHNSPSMVRYSGNNRYPMYWIEEVPYVC